MERRAVQLGDLFAQRKSQPRAALRTCARFVHHVKRLRDARERLLRDAPSGVGHAEAIAEVRALRAERHVKTAVDGRGRDLRLLRSAVFRSGRLAGIVALAVAQRCAAAAVQLYARWPSLLGAGIGLVLLGIGLEYAQGALTDTRMQDAADAFANTLGVIVGLSTRLTPFRDVLLQLDTRGLDGVGR